MKSVKSTDAVERLKRLTEEKSVIVEVCFKRTQRIRVERPDSIDSQSFSIP